KIDGQFVRDLVDDPLDEVAVRCFIDVAKVMGLTTVAEFVDKPAVLERLQAMDIDYAQGYLLHEPAPIAAWRPGVAWEGQHPSRVARPSVRCISSMHDCVRTTEGGVRRNTKGN
ncbi:MAG: EAL domain-containing protein, partial [Betaproteobacteria bacterium]